MCVCVCVGYLTHSKDFDLSSLLLLPLDFKLRPVKSHIMMSKERERGGGREGGREGRERDEMKILSIS